MPTSLTTPMQASREVNGASHMRNQTVTCILILSTCILALTV